MCAHCGHTISAKNRNFSCCSNRFFVSACVKTLWKLYLARTSQNLEQQWCHITKSTKNIKKYSLAMRITQTPNWLCCLHFGDVISFWQKKKHRSKWLHRDRIVIKLKRFKLMAMKFTASATACHLVHQAARSSNASQRHSKALLIQKVFILSTLSLLIWYLHIFIHPVHIRQSMLNVDISIARTLKQFNQIFLIKNCLFMCNILCIYSSIITFKMIILSDRFVDKFHLITHSLDCMGVCV